MFFMRNEKKKKHPLMSMALGALSIYGAYSVVSNIKGCICSKMKCIGNKMGIGKMMQSGKCECGDSECKTECKKDSAEA